MRSLETQVNAFLHANAASRLANEKVGPFHIGFDSEDPLIWLNYAVPEPGADPSAEDIAALVAAFRKRERTPRLEFAPIGAPLVEPALLAAGFEVQQRVPLMVCAPQDATAPKPIDGVSIEVSGGTITEKSAFGVALAQHEAFVVDGADSSLVDLAAETAGIRSGVDRGGYAVLAVGAEGSPDAGVPMGGGTFTAPRLGTTEVAGIAVRTSFRRRGIGAAVTAALTRAAFDDGLACVWLAPAGPEQERLYTTVGYRSAGEMLFILQP
jgi:ribosomal protein S18 acetylase RimI-like enzyme